MCGIFGYIGTAPPDPGRLRAIARITEQRGRHAYGFAWIDERGRLHHYKQPGPISDNLGDLAAIGKCRALIAHCRYATAGSPEDNANNHPHAVDGGWLVHNGIVGNLGAIEATETLPFNTACDTEAIARMIERANGDLLHRVHRGCSWTTGPCTIAALWPRPTRLVTYRRENPLHFGQTRGGWYFASLPEGLPGRVTAGPNNTAAIFRLTRTGVEATGYTSSKTAPLLIGA